jgi:hypothetical protein
MEETRTRVKLVDEPDVQAHGLAATVSRKEVEEAAKADDGQAELVLDVSRTVGENGGRRVETRTVAVAWERAEIEKLLAQTQGDQVTIAIDHASLEQALEEGDVEGHGLRERAVVLTVAAVTAVGAGSAAAYPDEGGGPKGSSTDSYAAIESVRAAQPATGESSGAYAIEDIRAGQPAPEGTSDAYAIENIRAEEPRPAPEATSDAYAIEDIRAGQPAPEGTSGAYAIEDIRAGQPAPGGAEGYAIEDIRAGQPAAGASEGYAIEDVRAGGTVTPAPDAHSIEAVRGAEPAPQASGGDEGITISAPSPAEAAGIAGAVALAITGAAFAVRGRRQPRPT